MQGCQRWRDGEWQTEKASHERGDGREKVYGEEGGMGCQMNKWEEEEEMRILEMKEKKGRDWECKTVHKYSGRVMN